MEPLEPLDQLNLVLLMSWPSPGLGIGVDPVFHRAGYAVWRIGPPMSVTPATSVSARRAGIPMKQTVSPELVLKHEGDRQTLVVECKKRGFGPAVTKDGSSQPRKQHPVYQANALLSIVGDQIATNAGFDDPPSWSGGLMYVVNAGDEGRLDETLTILSAGLTGAGIPCQPASAVGVDSRADGLYVVFSTPTPIFGTSGRRVLALSEGDSRAVLQLLPLIPFDTTIGTPTDSQREAFEERLRSALASKIGQNVGRTPFSFTVDDVLRSTSQAWDVWMDKKPKDYMKRMAGEYVGSVIGSLKTYLDSENHRVTITFDKREVRWGKTGMPAARLVRKALTSATYRQGRIDLWGTVQGDLFKDP